MRTRSRLLFLSMMLLGVVIGLFLSAGLQRALSPSGQPAAEPVAAAQQGMGRAPAAREELDPEERHTIALFKQASPSVAYITTQVEQVDFWTRSVTEIPSGTGSGFVWDERGHVVTNFHVVQDGDSAKVTLGQDDYPAKVVGFARDQDLAVLQIQAPREKLVPIKVGTSSGLQVGQKVYAIGNPFGLDWSLTTGIVSALDRALEGEDGNRIEHLIQTDAAINPGNSGGPLLDSAGRLIGMDTAIYSPSGAWAGIGFAVPIDTVNRVVPTLIQHGRYVRPSLEIDVDDDVNDLLSSRLGISGVFVLGVKPKGPAAAAGLRAARIERGGTVIAGDVIVSINDRAVTGVSRLQSRLDDFSPGDRIRLGVLREGKRIAVEATLVAGR